MRNFVQFFMTRRSAPIWAGAIVLGLGFAALGTRALAQDSPSADAPDLPASPGRNMIEDGAQLLLRGLLSEMEPKLRELDEKWQKLAPQLEAIGPQLSAAAKLMGDLQNYQMPEMLPNGDILIRRKLIDNLPPPNLPPPSAPPHPSAPPNSTETEL